MVTCTWPLTASLPPCLPASLPPCLLASLPPSASLCLPLPPFSLYLSLPLSASLCLPLPPFASLLLCTVLCECVTAALLHMLFAKTRSVKVNIFMTLCTTLSLSYTIVGTTKASQISRDGLSLHRLYAELSTGGPSPESNPNSPLPVKLFTLARNVNADFIITLRSTLSLFLEHHWPSHAFLFRKGQSSRSSLCGLILVSEQLSK